MSNVDSAKTRQPKRNRTGAWIAGGLLVGILCGVLFGEYSRIGDCRERLRRAAADDRVALPDGCLGSENGTPQSSTSQENRRGGPGHPVAVLGDRGCVDRRGIRIPAARPGRVVHSPSPPSAAGEADFLERFIPTNIFRSLSGEYVPAVVVFCLFFGWR